jgi:hypothetical protein
MTLFDKFKLTDNVEKDDINRITALCPVREKAFFTIMRQSGLTPNAIKKLRIKDLEPSLQIPCKIDSPKGDLEPPAFIGEEAVRYLKQYLATRKDDLNPESLLFTIHNNPRREINTKDVSRTFRLAAEKVAKGKTRRLRLFSLVTFYRNNAKHYLKELKNHPLADDESYKTLYKQHALPFLEIETQITVQIRGPRKWFHEKIESQNSQIKELRQTIVRDNEYISSILSLLYDNKGDWDTGENVKLGDNFIKLWQRASDEQLMNNIEFLNGRSKYVPCVDILEELTRTLESILKPYEELKKQTKANNHSRSQPNNKKPSF